MHGNTTQQQANSGSHRGLSVADHVQNVTSSCTRTGDILHVTDRYWREWLRVSSTKETRSISGRGGNGGTVWRVCLLPVSTQRQLLGISTAFMILAPTCTSVLSSNLCFFYLSYSSYSSFTYFTDTVDAVCHTTWINEHDDDDDDDNDNVKHAQANLQAKQNCGH